MEPATASTSAVATANAQSAMLVQITTDGVPKLHCPVCNKALISLNGYVNHVKKHDPPGGFLCRYCDARFCSDEQLKRHRDEVHTTIACRMCKDPPVTFTNETDYRTHIRDSHNGIDREMYKCDKCGAEYKTVDPYRRHMATECGKVKPYKCDQCAMTFVTKYNLKHHKESHSGERKYCCSYCGKNFLQKGRLIEHERSHTGEKPYKCDVCGKCFAHRESIVTHSSLHTGVRLVECKCCQSRFSCYSNLIKHRRTRPDTCGRPEFDPPRNRVRLNQSRIPATLNPTSEIKVVNENKIINPGLKEQVKKPANTTARKRTGPGPTPKQKPGRKKKKVVSESESESDAAIDYEDEVYIDEEHVDDNEDDDEGDIIAAEIDLLVEHVNDSVADNEDDDDDFTTSTKSEISPTKRATRAVKRNTTTSSASDSTETVKKAVNKRIWSDSDSDDDYKSPVSKVPIKQESEPTDLNETNGFEYSDAGQFSEHTSIAMNVKCEDTMSLFNEKDEIIETLLQSEDNEYVKMEDGQILEETEVLLIKNEDIASMTEEEDILDVKDLGNTDLTQCKIMLEDITLRYPKLKQEPSIKIARNTKPFYTLTKRDKQKLQSADRPKRKYRKRGEPKEPCKKSAKRVAKLSQKELKSRLQLLKKEGQSWKCPHCIKIYHIRKPFETHLRHDHQLVEDEIRDILKVDDIGVVNEEIFKCHICDKIYLMEKRLLAHIELHGSDGTLLHKCPCYCSQHFATKQEATAHARKEHHEQMFCTQCERYMTNTDALRSHIATYHADRAAGGKSKERNLVCDKCGKKFFGRTSLNDHVRSDCGRQPLYACHICGKHLTTAGILKTHLLLHREESPYQCDKCGKTFKVKAQYKTHITQRHTDYKPYKCHLCPKEYPYRESLLTHMTVHTGIKRFLCNGCGKRFTCVSNLQAHRKVHADTCGLLPLNAKATQYMGVKKGNLLLGTKPEAGLDYIETNTMLAKDVLNQDVPMSQEINYPSEHSPPLVTVPLNYSSHATSVAPLLQMPQMMQNYIADSDSSSYN